jgi:hypothetical protein
LSNAPSRRTEIQWNKGKNVTVKEEKKTQRHKGKGTIRTITREVPVPSFFDFFHFSLKDSAEAEEDAGASMDIELAEAFKQQLVPQAVFYFTGEAVEEDDGEYGEDELGEFDDEGDEEDEEDEEEIPAAKPAPKQAKAGGKGTGPVAPGQQPECRQQ